MPQNIQSSSGRVLGVRGSILKIQFSADSMPIVGEALRRPNPADDLNTLKFLGRLLKQLPHRL